MPNLPEEASLAWEERDGPAVLATVDASGNPNSVWVGAVRKVAEDRFVVADNYFHKTRANILAGSRGALLWITPNRKAFQVKGRIEYAASGPAYDEMRTWASDKHPREAATVLHVEEVYSGKEKLL